MTPVEFNLKALRHACGPQSVRSKSSPNAPNYFQSRLFAFARLCGVAQIGSRGMNTSREGRCVLKAAATQTDRDHLEARPASLPRGTGGDGTAAKPKTAPA